MGEEKERKNSMRPGYEWDEWWYSIHNIFSGNQNQLSRAAYFYHAVSVEERLHVR